MTITRLDWYCTQISETMNVRYLSGLRAKLQGLLKANHISLTVYDGLNKDIRDRSDWLKNRSRK
jgi:hypothetical protein